MVSLAVADGCVPDARPSRWISQGWSSLLTESRRTYFNLTPSPTGSASTPVRTSRACVRGGWICDLWCVRCKQNPSLKRKCSKTSIFIAQRCTMSTPGLREHVRARLSPGQYRHVEELLGLCPMTACPRCRGPPLAPCFLSELEVVFLCENDKVPW